MTSASRHELLQAALDQDLTDAGWAEFEAACAADPACLEEFARYAFIHAQLRDVLVGRAGARALQSASRRPFVLLPAEVQALPDAPPLMGGIPRRAPASLFAASVVMGLVLFVLSLLRIGHEESPRVAPPFAKPVVARVIEAQDAVWDAASSVAGLGEPLHAGSSVRLKSGRARVAFARGAEVELSGPANLAVAGRNAAGLESGKLTARVPRSAHGFTVETPQLRLTDRGTDFGVEVQPNRTFVHVFEGHVELASRDALDRTAPLLLEAGQSAEAPHPAEVRLVAASASAAVAERFAPRAAEPGAAVLQVDFGSRGQRVEAGWIAAVGGKKAAAEKLPEFAAPNGMRLRLEAPGLLGFRGIDPDAQRHSLDDEPHGAILEDFVLAHDGELTLHIQGVPAGEYRLTTWHNESSTEDKYRNIPLHRRFQVFVNGNPAVEGTVGIIPLGKTPEQRRATLQLPVRVAQGEDLVLRYRIMNPLREPFLILNGLQLQQLNSAPQEPEARTR